jgi:5-methylcytosine-specific restriction endonuclease McrA
MLKSCQYCGKIHARTFDCGKKPQRKKKYTDKDSIRSTYRWKLKAKEAKERDLFLCRICLEEGRITQEGLEAHHICPLEEDKDRAFDLENILTVCKRHHEDCEKGKISREYQVNLAKTEPNIPPGIAASKK